ncbi:MAG: oligosaccharide flippase family protein, partial [Erysipelotrichaceae bacterium]
KFFFSTLSGTILSAIIGITMGYMGYGVWALVTQTLTATIGSTVVLWFTVEFRPSLIFSFQRLQSLFSYGWKILFSTLLGTFYSSLRNLIIGKMYSTADLAYYNKGEQFPNLIIININSTIDNVLLPAMANVQNNLDNVKFMARKAIRTSSYMLWPCMVGLFVCAEPLVSIVLTDKWIEIVPYLRIFCIIYAFLPIQTTNTTTLKAIGKSDVLLKVEITKKIIGIISILLSMHYGVYCITLAALIVTPIEMFINIYPNKHFINYSFYEQLTDILPSILLSTAMGFSIWWLQYLALPNILILGLQISLGMFIYILLSFIFKVEQFKYVLSVAKTLINKFKFKIKKA